MLPTLALCNLELAGTRTSLANIYLSGDQKSEQILFLSTRTIDS